MNLIHDARRWSQSRFLLMVCLASLPGCEKAESSRSSSSGTTPVNYQQRAEELTKATGLPTHASPKAVALTSHYNFGVMDPMTIGTHKFTVRNDGGAPLKLLLLDSSCKCTVGKVEDEEIPPGGVGEVEMEWNTGNQVAYYKQWARIATNARDGSDLTFHIEGMVRQDIRFEPEVLDFGRLAPTESEERQVLVFSQRCKDFVIEDLQPSVGGFTYTVEAASEEALAPHHAIRGYVVTVQSPLDLKSGNYHELLNFSIKLDPDDQKSNQYAIPMRGAMRGRLSVLGQGIDALGYLRLGTLTFGKGASARLKVKVRDPLTELNIQAIRVKPDFLQVELTKSKGSVDGLYDLCVRVPENAPPCAHHGDAAANVCIEFDHPRIPKLDFDVLVSIRPLEDLN